MPSLQKNRFSVVVEELFLAFSERSHIDNSVGRYPHSSQGRNISDRRDDHYT